MGAFVGPIKAEVVGQRAPWTVPSGGVGCGEVGMWATLCPSCDPLVRAYGILTSLNSV